MKLPLLKYSTRGWLSMGSLSRLKKTYSSSASRVLTNYWSRTDTQGLDAHRPLQK